jgi:CRISPR-associated endoribonuclease Cas2 subtype I-E
MQSVALEIGVGVFVSPDMRRSVRERVWEVAQEWFPYQDSGSFVMVWAQSGGLQYLSLGEPPREISYLDGVPVTTSGRKTLIEHTGITRSFDGKSDS